MKKFAIITACNSKYENFLTNHWLKSLLDNIDTNLVDIIILDYGLSKEYVKNLLSKKIQITPCKCEGHIVNKRFSDAKSFMKKNDYEQVLFCDSGDIIFQKNITELFFKNTNDFRVVTEKLSNPLYKYLLIENPIEEKIKKEIINLLKEKQMINTGFILAPREKFIELCEFVENNIYDKKTFGPDQFLANLFLYKNGFIELDEGFNFIPIVSIKKFKIKNGIFLNEKNEPIPVVHNAGNFSFARSIENFGYGKEFNITKPDIYYLFRILRKLIP